jgi:cell division protein FtsQ
MRRSTAAGRTRAEEIRAKRSNPKPRTHYNPLQISQARLKSQVVPSRLVTTRGTISGVATRKRVQSSSKKAHYFALGTLGAEVRLPAIPTIRLGWRLLSGVIVLAMGIALYVMWNQPMFKIEQMALKGASLVKTSDITSLIPVNGESVIEINPVQLVKDITTAFPEFSKVTVQVSLPARLTVSVIERKPVISWEEADSILWIDASGIAFPAVDQSVTGLVQVIAQGKPPSMQTAEENKAEDNKAVNNSDAQKQEAAPSGAVPYISTDLVKAILDMAPQMPAATPIVYNPGYGLGWDDPEGWQVFIGSTTADLDLKLAQYHAIVEQLKQKGIKPQIISVEFPHAPYYRLEP